ncbi:hypothetical protein ACFP2T_06800 [Plantactinospora solaniradicis]|uniref:Uncharacterized protein n=1 Tax=Plantactinospora solaniradicis TaxID=1723736 RepID=A0ABW1K4G6_9ACTN
MKRSCLSVVGVALLLVLAGCGAGTSGAAATPTPPEDVFGRKACEANDAALDQMQPDNPDVMLAVVRDARQSTNKDIVLGAKLLNARIDSVVYYKGTGTNSEDYSAVELINESLAFNDRCHAAGLLPASASPPPADPANPDLLSVSRASGSVDNLHMMGVEKSGAWTYLDPEKDPEETRGQLTPEQNRQLLALFADPGRGAEDGWQPLDPNCAERVVYLVSTPDGGGTRWDICGPEPRVYGAIYRLLAEATPF